MQAKPVIVEEVERLRWRAFGTARPRMPGAGSLRSLQWNARLRIGPPVSSPHTNQNERLANAA